MISFNWFTFHPINLEEFSSHFRLDASQSQQYFSWWSEEYDLVASHFYRAQYARHRLLEFREFSREYSLKIKYPEELSDLSDSEQELEAWDLWRKESESLQKHRETIEPLMQISASPLKSFDSRDLLQEDLMLKHGWTDERRQSVKGLWFNSNITKPSTDSLRQLKTMEYRQYLQTTHWRRIRAAMLLIEQARCSACGIWADSYYGGDWETDIHVHHLHYRNKGFERYEDLQLLCKEHHHEAHTT